LYRIAVGPGTEDFKWTEALMRDIPRKLIEGISIHHYSVIDWSKKGSSTEFTESEYFSTMEQAYRMEKMISGNAEVMDKYDPEKKVGLVVDEWGAWYAPLPGSNPGFLVQQNSLRDAILAALNLNIFARHADRVRIANIAQMVNVLQAMVVTDKDKMVLTPTYHVFKMYVPFQGATFVPVTFQSGTYTVFDITLPRVDAIAAKDTQGKLWLAVTNLDANRPITIDATVAGGGARSAAGETLTAPKVDSVNTFDVPNTVAPKPISVKADGGKLSLELPPKSVTVVSLEQ
jgi:alpha-N-arabinofuranosidase